MVKKKSVTIKEVAQAAGVSAQTVSRVLNARPDVSMETRQRIQAIIADLGYSPNSVARSLIQGRTHTIGVVGYGLGYYGPARVLTGIERRATEMGYSLLLGLLREPEIDNGEEIFHNLFARQVDGIICAVPEIGANHDWIVKQYSHLSVPLVFINMQPLSGLAVAAVDNFLGGKLATQHLLDQGYCRIGIITGPLSWWEASQRLYGWQDALQAAGQPAGKEMIAAGDWYPSSGASGMEKLLRNCPTLEAVFVCNDPMAAGALQSARRMNLSVPGDLAVVGFDDVPEAAYYSPSLTTISQPLTELGAQAVNLLNEMLSSQQESQSRTAKATWLQPKLIVRESSIRPT
jgi:LacI family transcriptional regulator